MLYSTLTLSTPPLYMVRISQLSGVAFVLTVLFAATSMDSFAGGIASKGKSREPLAMGLIVEGNAGKFVKGPAVTKKTEVIGMLLRRSYRAAERKKEWGIVQTPTEANYFPAPAFVTGPDKHVLIQKGMSRVPAKCATLHTHERAECLYEANLKNSVRFKVSEK